MGVPITWRTINSEGAAGAYRPLQAAGNSINNAFDMFQKVIQQRQALDAGNVEAVDEGAKQAYLGRLQQLKTPEEVAAFEASPEASAMRQSMSSVRQGQVMAAPEARIASTRQSILAGQQYGEHHWNSLGFF